MLHYHPVWWEIAFLIIYVPWTLKQAILFMCVQSSFNAFYNKCLKPYTETQIQENKVYLVVTVFFICYIIFEKIGVQ